MIASLLTVSIISIITSCWHMSSITSRSSYDHINSIIDSSPIKVKTEERDEISHDDTKDDDDGYEDSEHNTGDDIPHYAKLGVDPIYIELFKKAQLLSKHDYASSHQHGKFGIVIGPTEGVFWHTLKALQNGKRIRSILQLNQTQQGISTKTKKDLKLALMASPEHVQILDSCSSYMINQQPSKINITRFKEKMSDAVIENLPDQNQLEEACRLWAMALYSITH